MSSVNENQIVKVGVIGSGFIANHHLFGYTRLSNIEIVGISSILEDQAKKLLEKHKLDIEIFEDYKALLKLDFDVVSICLPNFLHQKVAVDALKSDKHVIIEKPLARNIEEGKNILNVAEEVGKQVFYAENNMYAPAFRKVREVIEQGAVGDIYMARGKEQHSGPHSEWFYKKDKAGGGALIDLGIHDIACLMWFIQPDEIESAFCQTRTNVPDREEFGKCEVEDNAVGVLYTKNGAQITIEESWTAPGGYDMKFEIFGTEGQITVDPCRMTPLNVYSEEGYGYAVEKASSTSGWTYPVPEEAWTFGYPQEIAHFMKCLMEDQKPFTDGEYGLKVLAIVEAMYKSAESGNIEKVEIEKR